MPKNKNCIRRLYIIANRLAYKPTSKKELIEIIKEKTDDEICNSSIEKDMFLLKMDFDAPLKYNKRLEAYYLTENYDFKSALFNWLNV